MHAVALPRSELGRGTREHAILTVASIGIVVRSIRTHERLALQIAGSALAARATQAIGTALAIRGGDIRRAGGVGAGAGLLGIAGSRAGATDGAGGSEAAGAAAVLVGVVADGAGVELAGGGIAALVGAAAGGAAAVALLALLDDAVAALVARDGRHALVVGEAARLDAVAQQGRADVADGAGAEGGDAGPRRGVHDVAGAGVAGGAAEGTALLRVEDVAVRARLAVAVVHGAEGVAGFVRDHLPFRRGARDHVGPADRLALALGDARDAGLAEPGQADLGPRRAVGQQGPVGVVVRTVAAPLREGVEAGGDGVVAAAAHVPRCGLRWTAGTHTVHDGEVLETEGDVEGLFVEVGSRVDLSNHVRPRGFR